MEFSTLLEERRSIRAFAEGTTVSEDDIKKMIYYRKVSRYDFQLCPP